MANNELFDGYSMQDLYKQVVNNSRENRQELKTTVQKLSSLVKNIADVQILSPQISGYMNILIKNDELLVKIAAVASKLNAFTSRLQDGGPQELTDAQKAMVISSAKQQMKSILEQLRDTKVNAPGTLYDCKQQS